MKVEVRLRLQRDMQSAADKSVLEDVQEFIREALALEMSDLVKRYDFKPLRGDTSYYRLRIDDYRLGCRYDKHNRTLIIMRLLHREEIYRHFP